MIAGGRHLGRRFELLAQRFREVGHGAEFRHAALVIHWNT